MVCYYLIWKVMNNNVELCSDWLFHSAAHFSSSHSRKETQGKYIFQYFLSQLYRWVIILYIKCGHQGAAINMRGIETVFECMIAFYFHFRDCDRTIHSHREAFSAASRMFLMALLRCSPFIPRRLRVRNFSCLPRSTWSFQSRALARSPPPTEPTLTSQNLKPPSSSDEEDVLSWGM